MRQGTRGQLIIALGLSALPAPLALARPAPDAALSAQTPTAPSPGPSPSPGPAIERTPLGQPPSEAQPIDPDGTSASGSSPFDVGGSLQTLLALGFVLGLAVAAAAGVKAISKGRGGLLGALGPGGPSPSGVLEILGRYPVGRNQTLILLRLDRRVLLLHQTTRRRGESMRTLTEVTGTDEVASILLKTREEETERVDTGFREAMRRLETDYSAYESSAYENPVYESPVYESPGYESPAEPTPAIPTEQPGAAPGGDVVTLRSKLSRWAAGGAS